MSRMRLDFCGRPIEGKPSTFFSPFKALWLLVLAICALGFLKSYGEGVAEDEGSLPDWYPAVLAIFIALQYGSVPYLIFLTYRTYVHVHDKYGIDKEGSLLSASIWCRVCVTARMLRHTADHNTHPYVMCNERGLPSYAPEADYSMIHERGPPSHELEVV